MGRNTKKENLMYLGIWVLLLLTPIISITVRLAGHAEKDFSWEEVLMSWRVFVPYLIVFLIHNFLLAPLLIYKKKGLIYAAFTICLIALAQTYECSHHPKDRHKHERFEMAKDRPADMPPPPEMRSHHDDRPSRGPRHAPPPFFRQHEIISAIVMLLMLGMNLGVKHYFKSKEDEKALEELEKKNLEQQLEYLKYQINPHFFMNTLNNIHALVDIEPEEAKHSILELSKMMRYVLYEGAKSKVPLQKEIDFLNNYITLMKLRYTDKVRIDINFPEKASNKMVPPMLIITFVENAFKHGVSYQKDSFIEAAITTDEEKLHFICRNSKAGNSGKAQGGVGLTNTRQRLDLIYGEKYTLDINDDADTYSVTLDIPFLPND